MTNIEHTYKAESAAHAVRREYVERGVAVTLVAFDPSRNVYVFDTFDSLPVTPRRKAERLSDLPIFAWAWQGDSRDRHA